LGKIFIAEPKLNGKELEYVTNCIETNWISSKGSYVTEFEDKFSEYCGAKYGIATSSGTTALHLALAALGVKRGDEVIIPTFTMIATANAVRYTGAKPILVDSEPIMWNMDVSKIKARITERTKAIIPVHIYGHPVDMDPLMDLAEDHDLYVVEDAAEAHGAEYNGKRTGGIGHVGCFSFYANKIITTGEGGMVVTSDEDIDAKARLLVNHALEDEKRFWHRYVGFNYRMTNLQAAVGVAQLERIDAFVQTRRRNAKLFNSLLSSVDGLTLPVEEKRVKNVYWLYSILVEKSFGLTRDMLRQRLEAEGVETRNFFYPIHAQPVYARYYKNEGFPVAEDISGKGINLPSGNTLTEENVEFIANLIKRLRR